MWRLGPPAVLMVAFALVGLTTTPWRADVVRPPARRVATPVSTAISPAASLPAPRLVPTRPEPIVPSDGRIEAAPRPTANEPTAPVERLPEELAPIAPDIVVAMELPRADALRPPFVLGHAHVVESAYDGAPVPVALAPPAGDDIEGPEPGALYWWFGRRGLERIKVLGEAPR